LSAEGGRAHPGVRASRCGSHPRRRETALHAVKRAFTPHRCRPLDSRGGRPACRRALKPRAVSVTGRNRRDALPRSRGSRRRRRPTSRSLERASRRSEVRARKCVPARERVGRCGGPTQRGRLLGYQTQRVIAGMKAFTVLSVSSSRLLVAWWLDEQRSPVGGEPGAARGRSARAASSWAGGRRA